MFENGPDLWGADYPWPDPAGHKYERGHTIVVSGPAHATGAARLAARAALRVGSGLVSVASPPDAVPINAAALTAIMVKPIAGSGGLAALLKDKRFNAVAIGPGCGTGASTRDMVAAVLASSAGAVIDADALTAFKDDPNALFLLLREPAVLTPHEGEFERIFPGLLARSATRVEAVRAAAAIAKCTVLLKGPDTAIASPRRPRRHQHQCAAHTGDGGLGRCARGPHRRAHGARHGFHTTQPAQQSGCTGRRRLCSGRD